MTASSIAHRRKLRQILRVEPAHALLAQPVAELGLRAFLHELLQILPVPLVVTDPLAAHANGQQSAQDPDVFERRAKLKDQSFPVHLRLPAGRHVAKDNHAALELSASVAQGGDVKIEALLRVSQDLSFRAEVLL